MERVFDNSLLYQKNMLGACFLGYLFVPGCYLPFLGIKSIFEHVVVSFLVRLFLIFPPFSDK